MHKNNLTVFRRSSAKYLSALDEREHQSRQICSVSRCTSHWLWTAETRCHCSYPWWSAASNSFCHKTLSLHSNSTLNHSCRNNSSDCLQRNMMIWRCHRQQLLLMLRQSMTIRVNNLYSIHSVQWYIESYSVQIVCLLGLLLLQKWRFSLVVSRWSRSVSTGMGNRLYFDCIQL